WGGWGGGWGWWWLLWLAAVLLEAVPVRRPSGRGRAARLGGALGSQPAGSRAAWVDMAHGGRQLGMSGLLRDEPVHRLADAPVRRMALRRGAKLEHVHGLAGVHLHVIPHAVGHGHRIGGHRGEARARELGVERGGVV